MTPAVPDPAVEGLSEAEREALTEHFRAPMIALMAENGATYWHAKDTADRLSESAAKKLIPTVARILAARAAAPDALRAVWDEGYQAAETMARCWGHTDHWEDEPENPYQGGQ